jgi:hypothetical protein
MKDNLAKESILSLFAVCPLNSAEEFLDHIRKKAQKRENSSIHS